MAGASPHMATSPTTPGWPGKQVHPLFPSRSVVMFPFASMSTILASFAIEAGPADMARLILASLDSSAVAAIPAATAEESKEAKIKRAMSAGPASIAKDAKIVDMDAKGNMTTLRDGNNGWTCFPGHPGVVGDVAMCGDAPAMQWAMDWMGHKEKPTNTQPGIIYMLAG